jgi:hypothetical protein
MNPRPIQISMDGQTARRKFAEGLRQMTQNQGWLIKTFDPNSSVLEASIRWSSDIVENSYSSRYSQHTSVNSILELKAEIISGGSHTLIQWSYDAKATSWKDPSLQKADPKAQEYALETNYYILKSLGLIEQKG